MTRKHRQQPQTPQLRQIRRNQIYLGLTIVATLAIASQCNREETPDDALDLVFYETTAQCEADLNQQQAEYIALQQQYQAGHLEEAPTPPSMQVKDCAPQMLAAEREHAKTAPIYPSIADCQAEGVKCEPTPASEATRGFRPIYGGTYIDTEDTTSYTYISYGNSQYRVYAPHTVYRSITPGNIVTPYGREIAQISTGRVSAPRHSTFAAPARPTGASATGTIRGRSSQGFGSAFKSTGSRGK